ncbi:MAG TPA: WXG100 family type VII secretion target [Trebonia sp.]|nr:WXG100 family type VII secretion target [Trebonia sp.]
MSDYTKVIFSSMEQGEADFKQTYTALVNEVSTLESQLQGSLSEWIGSAQAAYHEAQAQWNAAMADMQQVLLQLGTVIGTANSNYQSAEAANTGLWS